MNSVIDTKNRLWRGDLLLNPCLAAYTSWHVGGLADRLFRPADLADCQQFLANCPAGEPVTWLGLGSNTLIREGGVRGTVILTQGGLREIAQLDATHVRVEAGVTCAKVAKFCSRLGLMGVAFLAGIPGTMGGALAMNAGAFGGETWAHVVAVETIDRTGNVRVRNAEDFTVAYRQVEGLGDEWFVAATLALQSGCAKEALQAIKSCLHQRGVTQPTGVFSGGSVFKNPKGDYAGRLLEVSGLKGQRIGGAVISEKHANFIVNDQNAKASDIEALIHLAQGVVMDKFSIRLQPEIKIIGEFF